MKPKTFEEFNQELLQRETKRYFDYCLWTKSYSQIQEVFLASHNNTTIDYTALLTSIISMAFKSDDSGINFSIQAHLWGCLYPVLKFGNEEQKKKIFPPLMTGEKLGALVYTDDSKNPVTYKKNRR